MRVVTVAHLAIGPDLPDPTAGSDAAAAGWVPVTEALEGEPGLAFDHREILVDGIERARAKLEYSPLATSFCGPTFTISELRNVYECVWGVSLDPRNFHRKVTSVAGFLLPVGETAQSGRGRPAQVYRPGPAKFLTPPILRAGSAAGPDAAPALPAS
jgi:8-oxo-dGTP diphosphatase